MKSTLDSLDALLDKIPVWLLAAVLLAILIVKGLWRRGVQT
jgi:hypothetical protein